MDCGCRFGDGNWASFRPGWILFGNSSDSRLNFSIVKLGDYVTPVSPYSKDGNPTVASFAVVFDLSVRSKSERDGIPPAEVGLSGILFVKL